MNTNRSNLTRLDDRCHVLMMAAAVVLALASGAFTTVAGTQVATVSQASAAAAPVLASAAGAGTVVAAAR